MTGQFEFDQLSAAVEAIKAGDSDAAKQHIDHLLAETENTDQTAAVILDHLPDVS
ncbi:hypothetical protein [Kitasatospora sp. NBC_01266]|uniref:hypothetical protein n=1 Tax=Kitasatospora sp. NBC_01266 TaxID=2903572 RepID=UPI002E30EF0A|nr:hypothetical protein [Kitasatospora sp. NBC_01266]